MTLLTTDLPPRAGRVVRNLDRQLASPRRTVDRPKALLSPGVHTGNRRAHQCPRTNTRRST
jgi:hypothetical protein